MARGLPGVWSTILSIPFFVGGAFVYVSAPLVPDLVALPLVLFGGFVFGIGWYVHLVGSPSGPTLMDDETIIDTRHPSQRGAVARLTLGMPALIIAGILLFFTMIPYIVPMAFLVVGLYAFSTGILAYWINSLTTYYVTTERVISEFRLLSLVRKEVPLEKVRAVRESQSPIDSLVGVGSIRISSGGGSDLEVIIEDVKDAAEFADELRQAS